MECILFWGWGLASVRINNLKLHLYIVYSFLFQNNIPVYKMYTMIYLSSVLLDIYVSCVCHASVCSSVLCLVTTKIWSNGH